MGLVSWFRSHKIDLNEEPQLFTGTVFIPVQQLGISKVVVVRTKKNGGVQ